VKLGVAQVITIDFRLEIGDITERLTVMGGSLLLDRSSSEIGVEATEKEFHTWPILVEEAQRQLQNFIFSSMPGTEGNTFEGTINGGQAFSHEILIDGLTLGRFDFTGGSLNEFGPSLDATTEVKLQTGTLSAQYGATQTAVANFVMKSGTNQYRGSLYWFHLNSALRAMTWTENLYQLDKRNWIENNLGGTFGGPLRLPGYQGKDRTHFFFSYEKGDLQNLSASGWVSMPSPAFKKGDFSALFDPAFTGDPRSGTVVGQDALGRNVIFGQIFDPSSARLLANNTWVLDPFLENIIPVERFSSISRRILELADTPDPEVADLHRNYPAVRGQPMRQRSTVSLKLDHSLGENHRLSGFLMFSNRSLAISGGYLPFPGSGTSSWSLTKTPGQLYRISEDWTLNATTLNHFSFGINWFVNRGESVHLGENWPEQIGLTGVGQATFPTIAFSGPSPALSGSYPRLGTRRSSDEPLQTLVLADDLSVTRGRHNLRVGFEFRHYRKGLYKAFDGGSFWFHSWATSQPNFSSNTGFAYASFLLGEVHQAELEIPVFNPQVRVGYSAFYFQDDWRIRPNLTLNWGLRWDLPGPLKEATDRMSKMDINTPNPDAAGYPGALVFLDNKRDSFQDSNYRQFAPRLGFAWSPSANLVLRGGYGINYVAPLENGWGFPFDAGFNGFNGVSRLSVPFPQAPALKWDDGYPPFDISELPNTDPSQRNGGPVFTLEATTLRLPYVQNWTLGIQHELPWGLVVESNYVGNKGTRLEDGMFAQSLNQLDSKYLSLGNTLYESIDQHPEIPRPYLGFDGPVYQALRPFPQYQSVSTTHLLGAASNYHALQMTATKRSQAGLSFLAAYTFSKALGTSDSVGIGLYTYQGQDFYNRKNERALTAFHRPHHLKVSWMYDLPFGEGRPWLNRGALGKILANWTISAIHSYRSGNPLSIVAGRYHWNSYLGNPPGGWRGDVLHPGEKQKIADFGPIDSVNGTPYLNPDAFGEPPGSSWNVGMRLGTAPRHLPDVRGPALHSEDVSIIKQTPLTDTSSFDVRLDIRNIFNRAGVGDPVTDISSPYFGKIFGNRYEPRQIQVGLRINF